MTIACYLGYINRLMSHFSLNERKSCVERDFALHFYYKIN